MQLGADGHHANKVRSLMSRDEQASASPVPRMLVPTQQYAQSVLDSEARRKRGVDAHGCGVPAYEALHELCTGTLVDQQRIILYHVPDPTLDPRDVQGGYAVPREAMHLIVFATPAMIDAAVAADEIGVDTKWRTNEDKGCIQAIMWFKQRRKPREREGYRPEFRAGYVNHDAQVLTIAMANLDNYWTVKLTIEAIRDMMPCSDPNCPHPIRRVAVDDRGSFALKRCCTARRHRFVPAAGQTDKAAYEVRALRQSGITPVLCRFHVYQAFLEYLTVGDRNRIAIKCHDTLGMLLLLFKSVSLGWTKEDVQARWTFVKAKVLPQLVDAVNFTTQQLQKVVTYIEAEWLCEYWVETWTHISRRVHGASGQAADDALAAILRGLLTSNNSVECLWKFYLQVVCEGSQFKRRDDEARAIGCNSTNLLDNLALSAQEAPNKRTSIKADVHGRTVLALAIVIRGGVSRGPNGIYYVRAGLSSRNILQFGSHRPENVEVRAPSRLRGVWNTVRVWTRQKFEARGAEKGLGWGVYCYHPDLGCECVDSTYRGQQRGGCKHQMACRLFESYEVGQARQGCIRDIAHAVREREKRTPRGLQVQAVLSKSDWEVWSYLNELAPVSTGRSERQREGRGARAGRVNYSKMVKSSYVASRAVSSKPASKWRGDYVSGSDSADEEHEERVELVELMRQDELLTEVHSLPPSLPRSRSLPSFTPPPFTPPATCNCTHITIVLRRSCKTSSHQQSLL